MEERVKNTHTLVLAERSLLQIFHSFGFVEVTKEMQEEIDNFNQQQGKKGKQWKNNRKNIPQQQQRPNQQPNPQQFQNKVRPVRPVQHQPFPR